MSNAYHHLETSSKHSLPPPIRQTLDGLRGLLGRFVLSQAFIQLLVWTVLAFWTFGIIDYLPAMLGAAESPRWVRIAMLALLIAGIVFVLYQQIVRRWLVRWSDASLALLIERRYPNFESSLVTTVQATQPSELVTGMSEHPNRAGVLALAREKALEVLPSVDIQTLIRTRSLQWQLIGLGGCLACSCVMGLLYPDWSWHWSKRLFALSNIAWPRNCEIGIDGIELEVPTFTGFTNRQRYMVAFRDNEVRVPRGQSGLLKSYAVLAAPRVPEVCTLYYRDDEGNRGRANLRRVSATPDRQGFVLDGPPLESISQSLWIHLVGGDARLSELRLMAVDAPFVTDLQLRATYPKYLQRSTQSRWGEETLPYRTGLRLPQGTELTMQVSANKPIVRCEYVLVRSTDEPGSTPSEQRVELGTPKSSLELPIGSLKGNLLAEIRLWDIDGICSSRVQQFVVSAIVDQTPQADMVLDGIGTAITEIASIPIVGKVRDEYDVAETWMESVLDEGKPFRTDLVLGADGMAKSTFDCKEWKDAGKLPMKVGSTLALTLSASDYYDLENQPHIGRANTVQLNIVTPDQLLLLLDRREAAMRKRMESIIGEVSQLRDLLQNISRNARPESPKESTAGPSATDGDSATSTNTNPPEAPTEVLARKTRLQLLRSQQAMSQVSKSEAELSGVEKEIDQISRELVNNRIDSVDRRTRWQDKIRAPLRQLLEKQWLDFANGVKSLEKNLGQSSIEQKDILQSTDQLLEQNTAILTMLQTILADMLEIQDQTAIVDMLRGIIDSSGELIDETKGLKKSQDRKALDLLK